ncbi:hypothetical protein ACFW4M_10725 [Streptomyces sp. NPDC058794]|uniref:hypothetical protein n=1 Tax=unclassified Streptomyces TaxID=2593676 RepID=UPI00369E0E64
MFDRVLDGFVLIVGLWCMVLGCWCLLQPYQAPDVVRGPVWAIRAWALGFALLGVSLTAEIVTLWSGGDPGRMAGMTRWVTGPLVIGPLLLAFVIRRRDRRRRAARSK